MNRKTAEQGTQNVEVKEFQAPASAHFIIHNSLFDIPELFYTAIAVRVAPGSRGFLP